MAKAVRWDLIADPRGFQRGFREANRSADTFSRGIKRTAGLIGAAFAGVQVAGFLKDAITEAREAAKVTRQTNAVIKATGGVANVSAKDVDRLATSLMKKAGVDDDVIKAGQNMLLTFKGVRDEAGKNNDIFSQATTVALDMTAAMNQGVVTQEGLEASNIRLGKALNDPIKGIASLTKVGVTFTDQQKDQIKKLVESGDKMEAQKIILGELKTEYGGAAEAAADPWQKVIVAFDEVKESIGTALLGPMNNVADFITGTLIPAAEKWWKEQGPKFREAFRKAAETAKDIWTVVKTEVIPALEELATKTLASVREGLDEMAKAWRDNKTAITDLGASLKDLKPVWDFIAFVIDKLATEEVPGFIKQVGILARIWRAAGNLIVDMNKFIATTFLESIRTIVRGAATVAEKLHLPFAKGLRDADKELASFRDKFNAKMDDLKNEGVDITVKGIWVPPKGSKLSMHDIVGRARGGAVFGRGTATSDSIPAMLSTGEHVLSAREVQGMGGHSTIERMRKVARGFARGGAILPDLRLPSPGGLAGAASSGIGRIAAALDRLTLNVPLRGNANIMSFIRSADALPYVWGGVGPGGYDCSGLVGEVMARHLGLPSYRRYFTTSSIGAGQYGLKSGLGGVLDIGVTAGTGHMAGSYMGMGFEAESSRTGIKIGGAASPPGSFARRYHLASGGAIDPRFLRAYDIGGDPGRLRINGKVFDRGGMLQPGATLAVNTTGSAEPVGIDYERMADAFVRALEARPPAVYLDRQKVSRAVRDGDLWESRR